MKNVDSYILNEIIVRKFHQILSYKDFWRKRKRQNYHH